LAYDDYPPYVSVGERRRRAALEIAKRKKKGLAVDPVVIDGRTIARTFWGKAWCDHLERYSDYANRLPRGRTYVRNGSVLHLDIGRARVDALVQGTDLYEVGVTIDPLPNQRWTKIVESCAGQIDSLVELVQGKLSSGVMKVVTEQASGLFPQPKQIRMECSCPDSAGMCKHIAAVLYGTGARLDGKPELLFVLRGVDPLDLIEGAGKATLPVTRRKGASRGQIPSDDLASVFGIEMDTGRKGARSVRKAGARSRSRPRAK
jgi:uncharacterized Zn finger protein